MSISYEWKIEDIQWYVPSGMIFHVKAHYVGIENISEDVVFSHTIIKSLYLPSASDPISLDKVTPTIVKSWLDSFYSAEIPAMKEEINLKIKNNIQEYLQELIIEVYPDNVKSLRGNGISYDLPNDDWTLDYLSN